ncbi:MAG: hypothetical protein DI560_15280 [Pseudomonas putida]|nr:MAG: hypothetical protein DI560_15280 [Pseudomonas putida]
MSNVLEFPRPEATVHINDETMSLLTSDQLIYRIWDLLDSTVEFIGNPDDPKSGDHWHFNHQEAFCNALEAQICARVLVRRMVGAEPREIQMELTRRLLQKLGIPNEGGKA